MFGLQSEIGPFHEIIFHGAFGVWEGECKPNIISVIFAFVAEAEAILPFGPSNHGVVEDLGKA